MTKQEFLELIEYAPDDAEIIVNDSIGFCYDIDSVNVEPDGDIAVSVA